MALRLDGGTGITADNIADGAITAAKISSDVKTPAGVIGYFGMSSAPTGWLKCNGAAISRTTYSDLFAEIRTTFGTGDGSTTFNVPDLRGEFVRSLDDGAGVDTGRTLASTQSYALENFTGVFNSGQYYSYAYATGVFAASGNNAHRTYASGTNAGLQLTIDASRQVNTSTETRPRNVALLACIKY